MNLPIYDVYIDGNPNKIELIKTGEQKFTVKINDKAFNVELPIDNLVLGDEFQIIVNKNLYEIEIPEIITEAEFPVKVNDITFKAEMKTTMQRRTSTAFQPSIVTSSEIASVTQKVDEGSIVAPMAGKIISVMVERGDLVEEDQVLCILEAMKMVNEILASDTGIVKEVCVSEGASVNKGDVLFVIE